MPAKTQSPPPLELSWTWLAASDPGLLRFRFAARVTLSVTLTLLAMVAVGAVTGQSPRAMALGFVISLFGIVAVRDSDRNARLVTTLLATLPAGAAFAAATLLSPWPVAADALFLAIIFAAALVRGRGPRWAALGMLGYMACFLGEYLHPPVSQLPAQLLGLAVGTAVAVLTRFVLLPERPDRALPRLLRAVHRQVALLLNQTGDAMKAGRWPDAQRRRVRHGLAALNEAVLMAEERADQATRGGNGPETDRLRLHLFLLERAAERIVTTAWTEKPSRRDHARFRPLFRAVRTLERRLRSGGCQRRTDQLALDTGEGLTSALLELERALDTAPPVARRTLAGEVPFAEEPEQAERQSDHRPKTVMPAKSGVDMPLGLSPSHVLAIQVTTACGIAMAAGHLISSQRWFWAVITAFVIFNGVSSRGDAFYRGLQRVAGTVLGVIAGVLIATLLAGDTRIETVLILATIFLAFYSFQVSYAVMIFWFTIMVALFYGAMGYFSPHLLVVRLEETLVGAVAGIGVAALLLPTRTHAALHDAVRGFLTALDRVVAAGVGTGIGTGTDTRDGPPIDLLRDLDHAFQAVRDSASALTFGWGLRAPGLTGRDLALLMACRYWAREFATSAARDATESAEVRKQAERTRAEIQALSDRLGSRARHESTDQGLLPADQPSEGPARALDNIAAAVSHFASDARSQS